MSLRSKRRLSKAVLSAGGGYRLLETDDIKWLYAAYKGGGLAHFPPDLPPAEFQEFAVAEITKWDGAFLLEARVEGHPKPVGMMVARVHQHRMEPHSSWFPWATGKQKLAAMAAFLNGVRREWLALVWCPPADEKFFLRIARYGILRRIGAVPGWVPGGSAVLFSTTSVKD